MRLIYNIKKKLFQNSLSKLSTTDSNKVFHFEKCNTILILVDTDYLPKNKDFDKFIHDLERVGKKVRTLFYSSNDIESLPNSFSKKDIKFNFIPKEGIVDTYKMSKFDLVINLYNTNSFPLIYTSKYISGNFNIGVEKNDFIDFDILLSLEKNNIKNFSSLFFKIMEIFSSSKNTKQNKQTAYQKIGIPLRAK